MICAPLLLAASHDVSSFSCGSEAFDNWLRKRALANQSTGASRTYVVAEDRLVIGYCALASGGVAAIEAPGNVRRNMPDPVPVMILARLAIDSRWQGKGIGGDLLRDAVLRTVQAAEIGGIRALLVHALDGSAARFCERYGFKPSPIRPLTYFLQLPGIKT
jgi:GNAT superfamily N-acetyltransferase